MGLDMYLTRHTYVRNWDHTPVEHRFSFTILQGEEPVNYIDTEKIREIVEDVGYWRKANAIHLWFVKHVQDGVDDCKEYYVPEETLLELRAACLEVIARSDMVDGMVTEGYRLSSDTDGKFLPLLTPGKTIVDETVAEKLLPTTDGFFFGSTDYDQYYIEDLQHTIKIIDHCLAMDNSRSSFYYQSSW